MRRANYSIVQDDFLQEQPLIIRDVGPWDRAMSVTNAAEEVVAELKAQGKLPPGRRLFYYDSEGELDEIMHNEAGFIGFKPSPR